MLRSAQHDINSMTSINDRVDALFAQWDKTDSPGCVLGVIKDGEFIYKRGYGMADLECRVPITPVSIFDIGSTGKQFTAAMIAILAAQGLLSLDDPIRKYLPEMPVYADNITIRHLVHHTSGLRDYLTLMDAQGLPDENIYAEQFLFDLIAKQKGLNFKPGNEFLYSNTGYFLLGHIAERITRKHITELIKEFIFDPLGMQQSTFNRDYRPIVRNHAMSYAPGKDGNSFVNDIALLGGTGDGPILTNVEDLSLWDRNFYDNKLNNAQPDLIEQLHQTGRLNDGRSITYAFGLVVDTYKGQRIVSHGGSWAGYRTEMMRFLDERFTVICISNLGSIDPTSLCMQVADIYLDDKIKSGPVKKIDLSADEMEQYTGIYQGKYLTVEVFVRDASLYLTLGTREYRLTPVAKKKFQLDESLDVLSFSGRQNDRLSFIEYGIQTETYKRIRKQRAKPQDLSLYTGGFLCKELDVRYSINFNGGGLQLKRNPYDMLNHLRFFTEDTLLCDFGELRFKFKDEIAKGFTLNADRVINLKFRRIK